MTELNQQEHAGNEDDIQSGNFDEETAANNNSIDFEKIKEELKKEIKSEVEEIQAKQKTMIAGLNRKNSELEKALRMKDLEGKTEAEKAEIARAEKEKLEKEAENLKRDMFIHKELNNVGLPIEHFANRIIGNSHEEIIEDIERNKTFLEKYASEEKIKFKNQIMSGKVPQNGKSPGDEKTILRSEFDKMNPLKRQEIVGSGVNILEE